MENNAEKAAAGDGRADQFDLERFVQAQNGIYRQALDEIKAGQKRSHWMWYIFPQYKGLGSSPTSKHYAIKSLAEAEAFLRHPVLGSRLVECTNAVLQHRNVSPREIFGSPDDMKLHSSATLFATVAPEGAPFDRLLDQFFDGKKDENTIGLLKAERT